MTAVQLLPRSPMPTSPPELSLLRRRPCEDCTTQVFQTWVPVDVTTTSCSTTSSSVWSSPWSIPTSTEGSEVIAWTATPTTAAATTATATVAHAATCTTTTTATAAAKTKGSHNSKDPSSATCCKRKWRWPVGWSPQQVAWNAEPDIGTFPGPSQTSLQELQRLLQKRQLEHLIQSSPDIRSKRWDDGDSQLPAETATDTLTSTTTLRTTISPTSWPSKSDLDEKSDQALCRSGSWCNTQHESPASHLDQLCGCVVAWVTVILGAVPSRNADLAASLCFFFLFLLFSVVCFLRIFACRKNRRVLLNLAPVALFDLGMLCYFGMRAWTANNVPDKRHIVVLHSLLMCAPLFLIEAAMQLFGLLARRAEKGAWISYSSYVLRLVNAAMLFLSAIAAGALDSFLNDWINKGDNCDSTHSQALSLIPLVVDLFITLCLILLALLTVRIRMCHCLPMAVLIHVISISFFFFLHFLWRILRDVAAVSTWSAGWDNWQPPASAMSGNGVTSDALATCWGVESNGKPNWAQLAAVRQGAETPTLFYLLGILPLVVALTLLYTANLPLYVDATTVPAPPKPDPNARYRMTFNASTQRMEVSRVAETELAAAAAAAQKSGSAPTDKDGKPYYRLVRSHTGKWKFKSTSSPGPNGSRTAQQVKGFLFGWPN